MRPNQEYLKRFLEICEDFPTPVFNITDLKAAGLDHDTDEFVFHIGVLHDLGLIESEDKKCGFGLQRGADGYVSWAVLPLRLTAQGHQFAEALRNKEVWATIKRDFKDASINTLWDTSKQLLEAFVKQKIEKVLSGELP